MGAILYRGISCNLGSEFFLYIGTVPLQDFVSTIINTIPTKYSEC